MRVTTASVTRSITFSYYRAALEACLGSSLSLRVRCKSRLDNCRVEGREQWSKRMLSVCSSSNAGSHPPTPSLVALPPDGRRGSGRLCPIPRARLATMLLPCRRCGTRRPFPTPRREDGSDSVCYRYLSFHRITYFPLCAAPVVWLQYTIYIVPFPFP